MVKAKKEKEMCESDCRCGCGPWHKPGCSGVYGLGVIGALVYFISTTSGFWNIILAILKSLVWPAFVVYKILGL